jgi:hypothetical protein
MDAKERERERTTFATGRQKTRCISETLATFFSFCYTSRSPLANSHFEELETLTADTYTLTSPPRLTRRPIPQRSLVRALLRKQNAHHRPPTPMPLPARLDPAPPLRSSTLTGPDLNTHRLVSGPLRGENHLGRRHLSEILQRPAPLAYSG